MNPAGTSTRVEAHRLPRAAAGFSLVELVIALALVLLVMLLAAGLLRESGLLFLEQRRAALDPFPELALARLRNDIQRSRGVAWAALPTPGENPLTLSLRDTQVRWVAREGRLERQLLALDGAVTSRQTVLAPIGSWSWSSLDGCLIDVSVLLVERDPTPRWTAPRPEAATHRARTLAARVGCRDRNGGTW